MQERNYAPDYHLNNVSANPAPSVVSPSASPRVEQGFAKKVAAPNAAADCPTIAREGARADYKFCSKESILNQLKTSKDDFSEIIEEMFAEDATMEKMKKIEITLKHAIKWIKLNSFSLRTKNNEVRDMPRKKKAIEEAKAQKKEVPEIKPEETQEL